MNMMPVIYTGSLLQRIPARAKADLLKAAKMWEAKGKHVIGALGNSLNGLKRSILVRSPLATKVGPAGDDVACGFHTPLKAAGRSLQSRP